MWEGIEYVIDPRKPIGKKISGVTYDGRPLDLNATYDVVMNSYRATGAETSLT